MKKNRRAHHHRGEHDHDDQSARLVTHMQHTLNYHESMLGDRERNQAFYSALKKHVRKGAAVMDIGSGTGLWAITAAKLGAARVVAIEREKMLIPVIEKLVARNGVSDRVEVIAGDSKEAKISGEFDLIVTETVGNDAFDEGIVPTIIDARQRFLKKGGVVIPGTVAAIAAPAHLRGRPRSFPAGVKLDYRYFESLNRDIPKKIIDRSKITLLGPPIILASVDLKTVTEQPTLSAKCIWKLKDASKFHCLVVWARMVLSKGITLETIRHSRAWNPVCLPVESLKKGPATIECTITISNRHYYWIISTVDQGKQLTQSHSPIFPYTSIQTHGKVPW